MALFVVITGAPGESLAAAPGIQRRIAITVDDLPGRLEQPTARALRDINRRMVAALKAKRVPAIGFVNERFLQIDGERDTRAGLLRIWIDGGMALGNHLYRHRSLTSTPLAAYQDDVLRGEVLTRPLLEQRGLPLVYFRHPFLHTGPTVEIKRGFEAFLATRGYKVAPATFDHSDWIFTRVYEHALARKDRGLKERTVAAFLHHFEQQAILAEQASMALFGREIPQILMTHANRINADHLAGWLSLLERRGYRFTSLDEALADPAYATPDTHAFREGVSWFTRWAAALERPLQRRQPPSIPEEIRESYREISTRAPEINE